MSEFLFSDSSPPPTTIGMGNNFETKHPRAKDGKFAEKLRKESGLELTFSDEDWKETEEYTLPKSVVEIDIAGEVEEIKDAGGNIVSKKYVAEVQGQEPVVCRETWEDGNLISRTYSEYSDPGDLVRDTQIPFIEAWYESGQPYRVMYRPTREQVKEYFQGDCGGERLVTSKGYFEDGTVSRTGYWEQRADGKLREIRKTFFEDGAKKSVITRNFEGEYDSIGGEPAFVAYFENGQVMAQEWYKDGKYHRERGPAAIEYTQDGQVIAEKYFLDGEEVPGAASLFGYAR